jgi:DNA-binding beta-propeller fold protein YncE
VTVDPGVLAVAERAGRVFVVASNMSSGKPGTVSVLDARGGRIIRTGTAVPVPYAVAVDERAGRAFVLNANNGGVGVYDGASGRFLGTFNDGPNGVPAIAPFALAVDARRARLFVITGNIFGQNPGTRLSVLDTRSGRLVRIPRVGMYPSGMVVDERLGRTLVSSAGGMSILDDRTGRVLRTIGGLAAELAVDGQHGRLFVATGTGIGSRGAYSGRAQRSASARRVCRPEPRRHGRGRAERTRLHRHRGPHGGPG